MAQLKREDVCGRCLWILDPELETCPNCGAWIESARSGDRVT